MSGRPVDIREGLRRGARELESRRYPEALNQLWPVLESLRIVDDELRSCLRALRTAYQALGVTRAVATIELFLGNWSDAERASSAPLDRARVAASQSQPDGGEHHLTEGIRLVQSELMSALTRVGVEGYSPKGEVFDPNVHEAIVQQPVDGAESGTVAEVYQQGYKLADMVIRPARVVVAA